MTPEKDLYITDLPPQERTDQNPNPGRRSRTRTPYIVVSPAELLEKSWEVEELVIRRDRRSAQREEGEVEGDRVQDDKGVRRLESRKRGKCLKGTRQISCGCRSWGGICRRPIPVLFFNDNTLGELS